MPIYEYRCERGHNFDVMQRITEDALTVCPEHGTPVQRVFHPVAVHFKGSGFYNTDYGKQKKAAASSADGAKGEGSSSSSSTQDGAKSETGKSASTPTKSSGSSNSGSSGSSSSSD